MSWKYESKRYDDYSQANQALERLLALGYERKEISVILGPRAVPESMADTVQTGAAKMGGSGSAVGAATGGVLGAIIASAALVATGGAAAPIIVGPLAAAAIGLGGGAVMGGIVGGLLELGIKADDLSDDGIMIAVRPKTEQDRERVRSSL